MLHVVTTALSSFDVLVGQHAASDGTGLDVAAFTLCHRYNRSAPQGEIEKIDCDDDDATRQGRYVAVIKRGSDVILHFCELEVIGSPGKAYTHIQGTLQVPGKSIVSSALDQLS